MLIIKLSLLFVLGGSTADELCSVFAMAIDIVLIFLVNVEKWKKHGAINKLRFSFPPNIFCLCFHSLFFEIGW